jgi:hypothetical protein
MYDCWQAENPPFSAIFRGFCFCENIPERIAVVGLQVFSGLVPQKGLVVLDDGCQPFVACLTCLMLKRQFFLPPFSTSTKGKTGLRNEKWKSKKFGYSSSPSHLLSDTNVAD